VEAGSDAQVIAASRSEPHAFATIFDRHFDAVHRYLARRVGADLAEEDVLLDKVDWLDADPPLVIGYTTYFVSEMVPTIP